ncbi:MAG: c-type cytochrome [Mariprofundaceae bacterium]|nr:c-type cytochrome [Mariprofundaceae bacterium]
MIYFLKILLLSNLLFTATAMAEEESGDNAIRGKIVAGVRCGSCHHLHSTHMKVGPSLAGVFGRKPRIQGVPFNIWDVAALQAWLVNPRQVKANTRMVLPKMSDRDRNDIIAWLKSEVK